MAEGAPSGPQHCFRSGHIPILGSALARKRDVEVCFAAQDRGHLAAHTADRPGISQRQSCQQLLQPLVPVVAAGHQHQFAQGPPAAEAHRLAISRPVFAPGLAGPSTEAGHHTQPQLLHLRQQHHPQHGFTAMHQRQMHGVLTGALQKILGAI